MPGTMLGPCVYSFILFSQVPSEADQVVLSLLREIKDQRKQRISHGLTDTHTGKSKVKT